MAANAHQVMLVMYPRDSWASIASGMPKYLSTSQQLANLLLRLANVFDTLAYLLPTSPDCGLLRTYLTVVVVVVV